MKTFKTRIYLNDFTVQYCKRAFGVRRCIWNWAVAESINGRKQHKKRPSAYALDKSYREYLKTQKDSCFVWLAEQQTSARLMQEVLKDVDQAFKLAVAKKGRKANVRFKKRKDRKQTFSGYCSMPADFRIEGDYSFSFQAAGRGRRGTGRTRESLAFLKNAKICKFTIKCVAGEYWIAISYEKPNRTITKSLNGAIGIDLGVVKSACAFDGTTHSDVSFNTKHSLHLDRLARQNDEKLSRKKEGSRRYKKLLLLKQRRALRATRCREAKLEEYTSYLTNTFKTIVVDDFTFKGALKVTDHEKAYRCMKYQFKIRLEQKAAVSGATIKYVEHHKGQKTTHKCSQCGSEHVHTNSQRQFHCLDCGYTADRDANAARCSFQLA